MRFRFWRAMRQDHNGTASKNGKTPFRFSASENAFPLFETGGQSKAAFPRPRPSAFRFSYYAPNVTHMTYPNAMHETV